MTSTLTHRFETRYKDAIKRLGLTNLILETTHIKQLNYGFSTLDHYLTTDPKLHDTTGVLMTNVSDHFCIFGTRKKHKEEHEKSPHKWRAYSKVNRDKFILDIENQDWSTVTNTYDSELAWLKFKEIFLNILHKHAPMKTFTTRDDRQPWICLDYLESANERDDLRLKANKTNSPK